MAATDELWFSRVESIVFHTIVSETEYLKSEYPDLNYTDSAVTEAPAKFPCVEITELQGIERGQTLFNDEIPAYLSTFQINVYDNTSKAIARDVMAEIISHFKQDLQFNIVAMPIYAQNGNIRRYSARCRRMIGAGDSFVQ